MKKYSNKELMFEKHYILTGKLFLVNLLVLIPAYLLGDYLDSLNGREFLFKIILILLAFPVTQFIIVMKFFKRNK